MCLGHFTHVKLSWARKLADHSLDKMTAEEVLLTAVSKTGCSECFSEAPEKENHFLGLQNKSRVKSQMEKEKVYPWTCHVY